MSSQLLKVAVIGTGSSLSVFHHPIIKILSDHYVLHSVVERSGKETCRESVGPSVKIVRTLDEVVDDPDVDLVVVSTPNKTHYEYCTKALEKGKHVLCEKPLVPTAREAEALFALAQKNNKILCVFQNRRWDADFLTVKKLIQSGQLGPLMEFTSHYDRFRPLSLVDRGIWKETPGEYNDSMYNLGSHLIDQAIALFGKPVKVTARSWGMRGVQGLDDSFSMTLEYTTPAASFAPLYVTVQAQILSPQDPQLRFVVKGLNGTFTKYGLDDQEADPKINGELQMVKGPNSEELLAPQKYPTINGDYAALYRDMHQAIMAGEPSRLAVKPEQSILLMRIIEAGFESSREGRTVAI